MAQPLKSIPHCPWEPSKSPPDPGPLASRGLLWIALHLSHLPLVAARDTDSGAPLAVIESRGGELRVAAANAVAESHGVEPGLKLGAALALSGSLRLLQRSAPAEQKALESLAAWALRFTPKVSLELPDALLLEVAGSLTLFGGLAAIESALSDELHRRRWTYRSAAAPTALAALWLARAGRTGFCPPERLVGCLSQVDLAVTRWPEEARTLLREMGVHTVGECLRLPRDGLARRVGRRYLLDLDKALGKRADPRPEHMPPPRLRSTIELDGEVEHAAALADPVGMLVARLARALRQRQAQVDGLELVFHHAHRPATVQPIHLAEPTHDPERFSRLIDDRLQQLRLPAPVVALSLRTGRLHSMGVQSEALFANHERRRLERLTAQELIELLRGRFGAERVHGIELAGEHRPEGAWAKCWRIDRGRRSPNSFLSPRAAWRPLWMLPSPLPLSGSDERPRYHGRVELLSGPERIESGWWDGNDVARDYYFASSERGEKLWIFRERTERRWYLHGIVG